MAENTETNLLPEIEDFLARTNMGESYFGKAAAQNSELVRRLRSGGRVWPETAARVRAFMAARCAQDSGSAAETKSFPVRNNYDGGRS